MFVSTKLERVDIEIDSSKIISDFEFMINEFTIR